MSEASQSLYNALAGYLDLETLVQIGEAEGLHLECKAPGSPQLGKDLKVTLAMALSGFANSAGGVFIWGISTQHQSHSDLDVLTQIEPIGRCASFAKQLAAVVPTLTTPSLTSVEHKVIRKGRSDSKGVVVTHIPEYSADPVQSNKDGHFYFRSGDVFAVAPYQMIQRMFAATESPDLQATFDARLVKLEDDGTWTIPIGVLNDSSAIAEHVYMQVQINNRHVCEAATMSKFSDVSYLNPGLTLFNLNFTGVIHRGINMILDNLKVRMKVGKRPRRRLDITILLHAHKMRARRFSYSLYLEKKGFSVKTHSSGYLY